MASSCTDYTDLRTGCVPCAATTVMVKYECLIEYNDNVYLFVSWSLFKIPRTGCSYIFTARKRSLWQGNIFTGVCLFTWEECIPACNGQGWTPPRDTHPGQTTPDTPLGRHPTPPEMTIEAGGTHPTGMHSCLNYVCIAGHFKVSNLVLWVREPGSRRSDAFLHWCSFYLSATWTRNAKCMTFITIITNICHKILQDQRPMFCFPLLKFSEFCCWRSTKVQVELNLKQFVDHSKLVYHTARKPKFLFDFRHHSMKTY